MRRDGEPELAQQHVFVGKNALSDHFALLAIRLLHRSLERAYLDGSDEAARADVMMGAMAAGCAFGTAGPAAAHAVHALDVWRVFRRAFKNQLITAESALNTSENPAELQQMLRGAYHGTTGQQYTT